MSKKSIVLIAVLLILASLYFSRNQIIVHIFYAYEQPNDKVEKLPLPELNPELEKELTTYLQNHFQTPEEYVIRKFQDHDIVFLGEMHRTRHDPELVQRLIPMLYQNGIYNLGMEFACYRDQPLIDSLLNAPVYDPEAINRVLFNFLVTWGFQEYADIFKAAWKLNRSLPDSARKFRVVGLNAFTDWSYVNTPEDIHKPEIYAKVFPDGSGDEMMGKVVLSEFVAKNQKALIYSGLHHAFTRYHQPIYNEWKKKVDEFIDNRMGNIVYRAISDRAFTICLHHPWVSAKGWSAPNVYPVDGLIDALMHKLGPDYYPVGFDTRSTPFGDLPAKTSFYRHGYEPFTLSDLCDGYIFIKPLSQFQNVRHIHGFINVGNVELARRRLSNVQRKNSFLWKLLSPAAVDTMFYSAVNTEWLCRKFY